MDNINIVWVTGFFSTEVDTSDLKSIFFKNNMMIANVDKTIILLIFLWVVQYLYSINFLTFLSFIGN